MHASFERGNNEKLPIGSYESFSIPTSVLILLSCYPSFFIVLRSVSISALNLLGFALRFVMEVEYYAAGWHLVSSQVLVLTNMSLRGWFLINHLLCYCPHRHRLQFKKRQQCSATRRDPVNRWDMLSKFSGSVDPKSACCMPWGCLPWMRIVRASPYYNESESWLSFVRLLLCSLGLRFESPLQFCSKDTDLEIRRMLPKKTVTDRVWRVATLFNPWLWVGVFSYSLSSCSSRWWDIRNCS